MAGGMSAKVFPWQIPEFMASCGALDLALGCASGGSGAARVAQLVARLFIVARGIRGTQGVQWLAGVARSSWDSFSGEHEQGRQYFQRVGRLLKCAYKKETARRGLRESWGSHKEGRHLSLSGPYFLHALGTKSGAAGAAAAAKALQAVLENYVCQRLEPREAERDGMAREN